MKLYGHEGTWKQWLLVHLFAPIAILGIPVGFIKEIFTLGIESGERNFIRLTKWAKGDR